MVKVLKAATLLAAVSGLATSASAQIVLYSQPPHMPGAAGADGLSAFQGGLPTPPPMYDREVGDDFTVPAAGWTVSTVKGSFVQFTDGDPNPVTGADIQFYLIAGGVVGPAIATATVINTSVANGPGVYFGRTEKILSFDISPVVLSAGTYFVKVNPIVNHNWFWLTADPTTPIAGSPAQIQRGPLTTAGTDATWPAVWQPTGPANPIFATAHDEAFTLMGQIGGGGPTGACCRTDGSCVVTNSTGCGSLGGIYRGDNSTCATANCPQPPTGSCCLPTGCQVLTQALCAAQMGTYGGNNTTCAGSGCVPSVWAEQGDAGNLPSNAQVVSAPGGGNLTRITGSLGSTTDVDMFQINICSPANFSAFVNAASTVGDTQLFLFDSTGLGVSSDDDDPQGTGGLHSRLTSQFVGSAGNYYLAISSYNEDPLGATTSQKIWLDTPFNVERRPDGPAAGEAVGSWDTGGGGTGTYQIDLTGSCFISTGPSCYANCDNSTTVPFLNVNDFICFQGRFAAGDSYANCDGSTQPPILNVNDFICFQGRFAAGCSAP